MFVTQYLSMCFVDENITLQCEKLATPDGLYKLPLQHGLFLIMPLFGTVVQYLLGTGQGLGNKSTR